MENDEIMAMWEKWGKMAVENYVHEAREWRIFK